MAQTTRNRLRAILTTEGAQMVLVDTPGIHKPHHPLGERLVQSARSAIGEVDLVLLLLEGCERPGRGDAFIVNLLRQQSLPQMVAPNKGTRCPGTPGCGGGGLRRVAGRYRLAPAPLQCPGGRGLWFFTTAMAAQLPLGPALSTDMACDQPERILLGELIREQVLMHTRRRCSTAWP